MYEPGELKTFNPNKEIAREVILEVIIRHRDALKQARTGELVGVAMENISDNKRKLNQVRALNLIISAQREMITISRPTIYFKDSRAWNKKYKKEEEKKTHIFEDEENDYNTLIELKRFLKYCAEIIIKAEKSPTLDDDFMITKTDTNGEEHNELTENFSDMLDELENSYEKIYLLMLTNKIVSAGIDEDEDISEKAKEEEAVRRIIES